MRPVSNARDMAVLYRVEVDVIDMAYEIVFVPQCVFPIAPLPNAAFAFAVAAV